MDLQPWSDLLAQAASELGQSTLLLAAGAAIVLGVAGSLVGRVLPVLGRFMRGLSTLSLVGILLLVVLQLARFDPRLDGALPAGLLPRQSIVGEETHLEMAKDGHFWLQATLNGHPVSLLVDTGASLTALSRETAEQAGIKPRPGGLSIQMMTANGAVNAQLGTLDELAFGNVVARGIDVVIAPNLGPTNVLGMNVLSRLKSWRVEGRTMVLVPHHPQAVAE